MLASKISLPFQMKNNSILIMFFCIGTIVFSANSNAACSGITSSNTISPPNISFNRNIPVNSQFGSDIASTPATIITCNSVSSTQTDFGIKISTGTLIGTINGRSVYSTNVSGIGFAAGMKITSPTACPTAIFWLSGTSRNLLGCTIVNSANATVTGQFYVAFYKISEIASNGIVNIDQSIRGITKVNGAWQGVEATVKVDPFTSNPTTCIVSNPASVTLSEINASYDLRQINSTGGVSNFSIDVHCPSKTNVAITFTDNNDKTQTGNILTPDANSTATGVAIQLKYLNSVIAFGPDSGVPGNINQILLNSNLTGTQSFPFSAYYIRTGEVTPGTLSSRATFSMSYQ